jgi:hypothetical protein
MAILDSLLVNLGFVVETKELNKFQKSVNGVRKDLIEFGLAAVAVGTTIFEGAKKFAEGAESLELSASRAGVTTKAYQELAESARLSGISQSSFTQALQQFNFNIGQASIGAGAGVRAFSFLGISIRNASGDIKSTQELLTEVSEGLQKLAPARRISIAQQLGFTSESVRFLLLGSERIKELREQVEQTGAVINEKGVKAGVEFSESIKLLGLRLRGIKLEIQETFLEPVNEAVEGLTKWIKTNDKIIKQNLKRFFKDLGAALHVVLIVFKDFFKIASALSAPIGGLLTVLESFLAFIIGKKVAEVILGVSETFMKLGTSIKAAAIALAEFDIAAAIGTITEAVAGLSAAVLTLDATLLPFEIGFAVAAAAAAGLALIVQDLIVFFQGGKSVIGDLANKFPILADALSGVKTAFKGVEMAAKFAWKAIKFLFDLLSTNPIDSFKKGIKSLEKTKFVQGIEQRFSKSGSQSVGVLSSDNIQSSFSPPGISTSGTSGSVTTNNSPTSNTSVTINVTDSPDSQRTANTIEKHLNNIARQAQRNLQNPVVG